MTAIDRRPPRSLTWVVARHLAVALAAGAVLFALGQLSDTTDQPLLWLAAAFALGLIAAAIDRGWLGLLFLLAGAVIGSSLDVAYSHAATQQAAAALGAAAAGYLAAMAVATAAYAGLRLVLRTRG